MIGDLGAPELLIILALVVLLFGIGKVGRLGKELGTSVKEFRRAVQDDEDKPPLQPGEPLPGQYAVVQPTAAPAPVVMEQPPVAPQPPADTPPAIF